MIRIDADFDYTNALVEGWNRKLRSVRIASFIISILLVVCALLCAFFPVQSAGVMGALAAILILALGVYQLIDYFCAPPSCGRPAGWSAASSTSSSGRCSSPPPPRSPSPPSPSSWGA